MKKETEQPESANGDRFRLIEKELRKRNNAELIEMMMTIAKTHATIARKLEDRLMVEKTVKMLAADVSSAIDRATDFDKRMINSNFDVDWRAYVDVQNGLARLVERGNLADAKSLALKLMKHGSHQVECSDEGLMSDEIIGCLKAVIRAVKVVGGKESAKWARAMLVADRVGFICENELIELRDGS